MQAIFSKFRESYYLSIILRNIVYLYLFFSFNLSVNSQWIQQVSGTTENLRGIYMHDSNNGWACGDGGIVIKTTNGGTNWFALNSGSTQSLSDIQFVNLNTGWFSTRIGGKIYKSTNGGINWFLQFETFQTIQAIYFVDTLFGWAADFGGTVFKTTDSGNNWDSIIVNFGLNDVQFINRNTGWVCGIASDIYKTTNSGTNWVQQLGNSSGGIASISFLNVNTGYAVNVERYRMFKTTNSGNNWILLDSLPDCFNAHHVFFSSVNTGWVSGDCGNIFRTSNGGFNWYQQLTGTSTFRRSIYFINDSIGWSAGGGGIILKTTTSGAIVNLNPISEKIPEKFSISQNFPNPFNPYTKLRFNISKESYVNIEIYDVLGKRVSELLSESMKAGEYEIEFDGSKLSSGIYFCRMNTDKFSGSIIMILTK